MIFNTLFIIIVEVLKFFINLFPTITFTMPDISGINSGISVIYYLITKPVATAVLVCVLFWLVAQPTAATIKFIYRKIPGIT